MEHVVEAEIPTGSLLLVDTAPIIYTLEGNKQFGKRFARIFQMYESGDVQLSVTTISIAEVLTGPLAAGEEALARRLRTELEAWQVIDLNADIAEDAARMRSRYALKLPDAIQVASALAINAEALVTHDRDFSKVRGVRILA